MGLKCGYKADINKINCMGFKWGLNVSLVSIRMLSNSQPIRIYDDQLVTLLCAAIHGKVKINPRCFALDGDYAYALNAMLMTHSQTLAPKSESVSEYPQPPPIATAILLLTNANPKSKAHFGFCGVNGWRGGGGLWWCMQGNWHAATWRQKYTINLHATCTFVYEYVCTRSHTHTHTHTGKHTLLWIEIVSTQ